MVFDISIAITWLLFLALFPMAFFWLRRAYRIFIKKDYSEVANLAAGGTALVTIIGVLLALFPYKTWSAMAGVTLWFKVFADYIVSRQAHPFELGRKKDKEKKAD